MNSFSEHWEARARAWRWPLWAVAALLALALAWICRFIQDDAFISFVYSRNLVHGEGLAWFGTRVEGYTNFLWVLWIAFGLKLGISPVAWADLGSMLSFAFVLAGLWTLARSLFCATLPSLLSVLLLATNYTVLAYATGGLETMTQAVALAGGRVPLEASGNMTLDRVRAVAETGVDFISVGALTHSARAVDISLDFVRRGGPA